MENRLDAPFNRREASISHSIQQLFYTNRKSVVLFLNNNFLNKRRIGHAQNLKSITALKRANPVSDCKSKIERVQCILSVGIRVGHFVADGEQR